MKGDNIGMSDRIVGLISVIMPCYNASMHISQAINSVLAQTYPFWELLIVDDGSTDGSNGIIASFASKDSGRIKVFLQKNRGAWPARNFALRRSHGQFIACLDADDYWREDFLERMVNTINQSNVDIVYCGWQNFGMKAVGVKPYTPESYEEGDPVRSFLLGCPWPIHAALTRWRIFELLNCFSEQYLRSMDYDFWLRTLSIGASYRRVAHVMAFYRWAGQEQLSNAKDKQTLNAQRIREQFVKRFPNVVGHIPVRERKKLMMTQIRRKVYELYWAGEMKGARRLFWDMLIRRALYFHDVRYLLISFIPVKLKLQLMKIRETK